MAREKLSNQRCGPDREPRAERGAAAGTAAHLNVNTIQDAGDTGHARQCSAARIICTYAACHGKYSCLPQFVCDNTFMALPLTEC